MYSIYSTVLSCTVSLLRNPAHYCYSMHCALMDSSICLCLKHKTKVPSLCRRQMPQAVALRAVAKLPFVALEKPIVTLRRRSPPRGPVGFDDVYDRAALTAVLINNVHRPPRERHEERDDRAAAAVGSALAGQQHLMMYSKLASSSIALSRSSLDASYVSILYRHPRCVRKTFHLYCTFIRPM